MAEAVTVVAWPVADTGLVTAPGGFRRLPGAVRHHQGRGNAWPARVHITIADGHLVVADVGTWPAAAVSARRVSSGPPVTFVLEVPGSAHLLAAAADSATESLLSALTR